MKHDENLWLRILILSLLILIVNSWSLHHLGNDITQLSIANAPLALIAIISFFTQFLKKEETSNFQDKIRSWFLFFLKTPVLIFLYILIFVAGSFVSSVTVMSSGVSNEMTLNLTPEGKSHQKVSVKELNGPNDIVHFIKLTTPFGRPFYLEVEGYLRHSFDLYPWKGKKIRVTKDLNISPSILVRIPTRAQKYLSRGKIVIVSKDKIIAEVNTKNGRGSILIGHDIPIPNHFIDKWKIELIAMDITGATAARSLLAWQQYQLVENIGSLVPDNILEARFVTLSENELISEAKTKIRSDKIQDLLMLIKEDN